MWLYKEWVSLLAFGAHDVNICAWHLQCMHALLPPSV